MILHSDITSDEFKKIQGRYTNFVKNISKPVKKEEDTLEQLDKFRYEEAPARYSQPDGAKKGQRQVIPLNSKDLQRLVSWKLKHGKFRPQLMKLVTSNTEEDVSKISKAGFEIYEADTSDTKGAIKKLSELKGVGPATASLLLSVHDVENVLFFGDEVFWWLCCKGKQESIKYNFKEHEDLMEKFREIVERLGEGVSAIDVERVGYVMMKDKELSDAVKEAEMTGVEASDDRVVKEKTEKEDEESLPASEVVEKKKKKKKGENTSRKRKNVTGDETGLRRSKRGKK